MLYRINEIFGPTIQGEGTMIGTPCIFIRTAGCDMRCTWCDTQYAFEESKKLTVEMIMAKVNELDNGQRFVVLTGGNPVIQEMSELVMALHNQRYTVQLETQGSIFKPWVGACDIVVVSPKPPSSGNVVLLEKLLPYYQLGAKTQFKVVVFNEDDLEYAAQIRKIFRHSVVTLQVGTPPGATTEVVLEGTRKLIERLKTHPVLCRTAVLPQLHVLLWGSKRGV